MLRKLPLTVLFPALLLGLLCAPRVYASLMGQVQGIVHDPGHRPIAGAHIELHAAHSALSFTAQTNPDGEFSIPAVPSGVYIITVSSKGFADLQQTLTVTSNGADILTSSSTSRPLLKPLRSMPTLRSPTLIPSRRIP